MISECMKKDKEIFSDYIKNDYYKALYLYIDFNEYCFSNDNVQAYLQEKENKIVCALLTFGDTLHLLSNGDYGAKEIADFIIEKNISVICGEKKLLEDVRKYLENDLFSAEYGFTMKLETGFAEVDMDNVCSSNLDDLEQVTNLLMLDDGFNTVYTKEKLLNQLIDLKEKGLIRSYIIKDKEKVIAHAGTGAENNELAIISYVIVDSDYRRQGYASKIVKSLCYDLQKDGKECYLVSYTNSAIKLYEKLGFKVCCEYGKIYKN